MPTMAVFLLFLYKNTPSKDDLYIYRKKSRKQKSQKKEQSYYNEKWQKNEKIPIKILNTFKL